VATIRKRSKHSYNVVCGDKIIGRILITKDRDGDWCVAGSAGGKKMWHRRECGFDTKSDAISEAADFARRLGCGR
jgi:hypothetical protein